MMELDGTFASGKGIGLEAELMAMLIPSRYCALGLSALIPQNNIPPA
jgi:hypothetical protein